MNKYKIFKILILLLGIGILWGCEDDVESPEVCYKLITSQDGIVGELTPMSLNPVTGEVENTGKYSVKVNKDIKFENCGDADFYIFFSGEEGNKYEDFIDPNDSTTTAKLPSDIGDITISYVNPGTYKAVMLLTNRQAKDPKNMKQATAEWEIVVTEDEDLSR